MSFLTDTQACDSVRCCIFQNIPLSVVVVVKVKVKAAFWLSMIVPLPTLRFCLHKLRSSSLFLKLFYFYFLLFQKASSAIKIYTACKWSSEMPTSGCATRQLLLISFYGPGIEVFFTTEPAALLTALKGQARKVKLPWVPSNSWYDL